MENGQRTVARAPKGKGVPKKSDDIRSKSTKSTAPSRQHKRKDAKISGIDVGEEASEPVNTK